MMLNWLNQVGEWNPQFLREVKGRLKLRNLLIAIVISILGQFLALQSFASQLPFGKENFFDHEIYNKYCKSVNHSYTCVRDAVGNLIIDWSKWWQDIFLALSLVAVFALLVGGTYLLVNDLSQEERRGTLNFIRLSPRSEKSILLGKLLGVPILIYIMAALMVPLHLFSGVAAQLSLGQILSFYGVFLGSCILIYSAALLYASVSARRVGFQAWLASGTVLLFLFVTVNLAWTSSPINNPITWLRLLGPIDFIAYLLPNLSYDSSYHGLKTLQWFYLPIGNSIIALTGLMLINYGLWTAWIWQALKRCFHSPNATILSKRQSYLFVACFEMVIVGFAQQGPRDGFSNFDNWVFTNLFLLAFFNALLFLGLMAVLSPHRQTLQDWARYKQQGVSTPKALRRLAIIKDLIWGERSPALVAIAINLAIATMIVVPWILLAPVAADIKIKSLYGVAFFISLIMIYATLAQSLLLMKTSKRSLWAVGSVSALLFVPPTILGVLSLTVDKHPDAWLFSTFPWVALEHATTTSILMALLSDWTILVLLNFTLVRQLRKAGESASKALLGSTKFTLPKP